MADEGMTMADLLRQLDTQKSVQVVDAAGRPWNVTRWPVLPNDYVPAVCVSCGHPGYSHGEDGGPCFAEDEDDERCDCRAWAGTD